MIHILVFLSTSFGLTVAEPPTYEEIKALGAACPPFDTCSTNGNVSDNKWLRTCECKPSCLKYGTCCVDYSMIHNMKSPWQNSLDETCEQVVTSSTTVFMKARCKHNAHCDPNIKSLCESSRNTLEDPLSVLPVTNPKTSITYKNYFCALCNDDAALDDLVFWKVHMMKILGKEEEEHLYDTTDLPENLTYDRVTNSWGIMKSLVEGDSSYFRSQVRVIDGEKKAFEEIHIGFAYPSHINNSITFCDPTVVSVCDSNWTDETVRDKCYSYTGMVYMYFNTSGGYQIPKRFRNVHCGICNFAMSDVLAQCHLGVGSASPPFSFTWLLDINPSDGDTVGEVKIKKTEKCRKGDTFDPFFKKCRTLRCIRPGYIVKDRKCIPP